jgi:cystathionine beta-synthase/cysteine synthase A
MGIDCTVTCPATTSGQKIGYMRAYGATVRLCPAVDSDHPDHYRATARRLAQEDGTCPIRASTTAGRAGRCGRRRAPT